MLSGRTIRRNHQLGFTLLEVMVTIVILAFGLLGLAGLEMKTRSVEMESYQRTQAMVILNDMASRLQTGRAKATDYLASAVGGGAVENCSALSGASLDLCEWANSLRGAGETTGGSQVGAMIGARGCITEIQAQNTSSGSCTPGIYEVSVAWQGMFKSAAPSSTCAQDVNYGGDSMRRVISLRVSAGTAGCT